MKTICAFLNDENGASAVEYCLLVSLIAVGVILGALTLGVSLRDLFLDKVVAALS
ncbi:MAG: Flp family type IVb pilin [Beijerinckiaceae bacterium]|jgi:pilus assembly protein Flp/PilA|nr:Flp family type IVb pilin [Beijerinckiaceae bacterium]